MAQLNVKKKNPNKNLSVGKYKDEKKKLRRKNALTEINEFCSIIRLFAYLTRGGTSPQDTISLLADDASGIFKQPFEEAKHYIIDEGLPISEGFYKTNFFPLEFISILRVGQSTGKLPEVLEEYGKYLNGVIVSQRGFNSALKYPTVMLMAAILGTTAIIVAVVPKLQASIQSMVGDKVVTLPLPTRILFGLHSILTVFGTPGVILLMLGLLYYFSFGPGKKHILMVIQKIPKVRKLMEKMQWAQFLIMASVCMKAGMTLAQMLFTMGEGELPPELSKGDAFKELYFNVKNGGKSFASELERAGVSRKLVSLISIAERKGHTQEVMQSYGEEIMDSVPFEINEVKVVVEGVAIGTITILGGSIVACVMITMLNMSSFV